MIGLKYFRRPAMKITLSVICLLLVRLGLPATMDTEVNHLQGILIWAQKYYQEGRYKETERKLTLLLSFVETEKEIQKIENFLYKRLIGDTWLLLGAINEKMGKKKAAVNYYNKVKGISRHLRMAGKAAIALDGLDFYGLPDAKTLFSIPDKPMASDSRRFM
jgi:tetratricopeptide (TPR) repeat protein